MILKVKDNPWFKELLKDAPIGGLAGIGITLIIIFFSNMFRLGVYTCLANIIFGFLVGFLITLGTELATGIPSSIFPSYLKMVPIQLCVSFVISSGIYYSFFYIYWLRLWRIKQVPLLYILFSSLGIGIASVMIFSFFIFKKNKEELLRLEKDSRNLAILEERSRIARELHDSVSQNLFGISLNLNTLNYLLEHDLDESRKTVEELQEMIQEVQSEMRLMIYELHPLSLTTKSFFEGMESLVNLFSSRYHLNINYQWLGKGDDLDSKTQLALFRVLQEALNNTVKHAKASKITVFIKAEGPRAEMKIQDNGRGFDPLNVKATGHMGILGMRERILELGGKFQIDSQPGNGTSVKVHV